MMSAHSTLAIAHASSAVQLAKDLDENKVTPGVLGFIVFALLGGAVWLLMKSMNKHMGQVDFEEEPEQPGPAADATDAGATGTGKGGAATGVKTAAKATAKSTATAQSTAKAKAKSTAGAPASAETGAPASAEAGGGTAEADREDGSAADS